MWIRYASKYDFNVKGMSVEVIKGKEKEEVIRWRDITGFLAYVFETVQDVLTSLCYTPPPDSCTDPEDCPHDDVENLWDGVDHATDRWECMECGQVMEDQDAYFL